MSLEKVFDFIKQIGLFKSFLALLVFTTVVLFWPNLLVSIGMNESLIDENKSLIISVFVFSLLMTLFTVIHVLYGEYKKYRHSDEQVALRYLKNSLTQDQLNFIDEVFFDKESNRYQQFRSIDKYDERGLELERHKIIEKGNEYNLYEGVYSYNLFSYSLKFLNNKKHIQ